MNPNSIREKFGGDYTADTQTFMMGIDRRFTEHFALRFQDRTVLETCTGAGFTTIPLARTAKHVVTVEIKLSHQQQAVKNVGRAGLLNHVTFIHGNILDQTVLEKLPSVDAAFIDPDWSITGSDHIYRFIDSNMHPPADAALHKILEITGNAAIVLPPLLDVRELSGLPEHEREKLYLGENHELFCLYFGELIKTVGQTEYHVPL